MFNSARRSTIVVALLILGALCGSSSVVIAQTTHTNTLTQTTSISTTNTLLTTITSPFITYTTTTETMNTTIVGTATVSQPFLTTVTSNYEATVSSTVTETISVILTQVSTQTTQLLGNIWGESLALALVVGALASFVVARLSTRRPRGIVCGKCGTRNPPFARAYCVKCGESLKEK